MVTLPLALMSIRRSPPRNTAVGRAPTRVQAPIERRRDMYLRTLGGVTVLLVAGTGPAQLQAATPLVPQVDHHRHLLSPAIADRLLEVPPAAIELPPELHRRFREARPRFNDATALADLYTEDAVLIFSFAPLGPAPETWLRGGERIANFPGKTAASIEL